MSPNVRKSASIALAIIALSCAASYARAQALPAQKTENGVTYITGGIGSDESQAMRAAQKNYNLRITTAAKADGAFLAGVQITVLHLKGQTVLSETAEGPYFFARLKPGSYKVRVDYQGATQTRTMQIPAKGGVDARFYW